jgi:hypothetical protein
VVFLLDWGVKDSGVPGVEVDVGLELEVLEQNLISELNLLSDLTQLKLR